MSARRSSPLVYEGLRAEEYKKMRNKWIRLAIVSTGVPFILSILVNMFNDTFKVLELFGNGEIILLLFSLNLPMAFDLFDMKQRDDENLSWVFWGCVIIICFQVALYCLIRMGNSKGNEVKSVIASFIMVIASWLECAFSIRVMYQHSIAEDGGEENVE